MKITLAAIPPITPTKNKMKAGPDPFEFKRIQ
jgi:hypothetical protein